MKILVTAFDPFGEEDINSALEAVMRLPDLIEDAKIYRLEVPTVFKKCDKIVRKKIDEIKPDVILAVGQAGGRSSITVERIAINIDDARIPDNEKNQPIDQVIRLDGENAYFTNLPIKAMVEAIKGEEIPASVSNSAGTFVCNHLMYQILYMIDKEYSHMLGGFIHVPFIPEQVIEKPNFPSMNLDDITRALEISIQTILRYGKRDIQQVGGTLH